MDLYFILRVDAVKGESAQQSCFNTHLTVDVGKLVIKIMNIFNDNFT